MPETAVSAAAETQVAEARDPAELEEWSALQGWESRYLPLEKGPFSASFSEVSLGRSLLSCERWSRRVSVTGTLRADIVPMGVVLHAPQAGWHSGAEFQTGDVLFMEPGAAFDLVAPASSQIVATYVPRAHLERVASGLGVPDVLKCMAETPVVRVDALRRGDLLRALSRGFEAGSLAAIESDELESTLVTGFLGLLADGSEDSLTPRRRSQVVGHARDFIEENLRGAVQLEDVARASGVSARTVQLAFRERFDVSPMEYVRLRRLSEIRRVLRKAAPGSLILANVATSYGCFHLGRFSAYYCELFGELPSQTLNARR